MKDDTKNPNREGGDMMSKQTYRYIVVGAGLAGASAVEGIRKHDKSGSILLIGEEQHLPYNRPPLSKELWVGKKKIDDIFVHQQDFYDQMGVKLALGTKAVRLETDQKNIVDKGGKSYHYDKLLLATGGRPKALPIPGGELDGICYYRYLDDYQRIKQEAKDGRSVIILGGGFIGSEMAAALRIKKLKVTMVFPADRLCSRVFPESLARAVTQRYLSAGIEILTEDTPASISRKKDVFVVQTTKGRQIESDIIIAGIGIVPETKLAEEANLELSKGIVVDQYLRTSNPDIYAAGDSAVFPYPALGLTMRVEHWDNAKNQGRSAGENMAGSQQPYTYMPYFFSDLFEFGYEAVGQVDSSLDTFADWKRENEAGVIYYLKDQRIRGVMLCNVWKKVEVARELIRRADLTTPENLKGLIR